MINITVTNPDGTKAGFNLISYQIEKYYDKSGTCEIILTPDATIQENSVLEAKYKGSVVFRGYIDFPEIEKDRECRIVAYEQQRLLEFRQTQFYEYPVGTTLEKMLTHDEPSTCVGLLYMANSLLLQGSFKIHSGSVYYIKDYLNRGGGTGSRFGTITKMYANTTLLTHGSNPSLGPGQWYQDANDLYIRMPDDRDPKYWLVSIPNWKDTKIRLSLHSSASSTISIPYRLGRTPIQNEISRMILAFGKEMQYQHENDGYTYLYINTNVGKGTSTMGVSTYKERHNIYDLSEEQTGDSKIDGLIGTGSGNGITQEVCSTLDLYGSGNWKEDIYSDPHQFEEQLTNSIAKVFPDKLDPFSYTISTAEDPAMNPGDWANVRKDNSMTITKRIKKITFTSDEKMSISLGQRMLDFSDVTQAKYDLLGSHNDFVNSYANSWTFSFNNDSITDSIPFEQSFDVELGDIDTEYPYKFVLNVNVGWYKETKGDVITQNHGHSGSTGGGGEHEHSGETEAGGAHPHSVPIVTTDATGWNIAVNYSQNDGDHLHSGGVDFDGYHSHDADVDLDTFSEITDEEEGHSHSVWDFYCSNVWISSDGEHSHELTQFASGEHSHDQVFVPGDGHTHEVPQSNTDYNNDDTRGIYQQDQHINPIYEEDNRETIDDNYAQLLETGNSIHYLTLTVKINGSNVDGSPFPNYYPGESISDIDITNLIDVDSDNTIWIGISEYNGSDPVRCSLNGSVSSRYFITTI
jgi:hypothetical protein